MKPVHGRALRRALREQAGLSAVRGDLKGLADAAPDPSGDDPAWATKMAVRIITQVAPRKRSHLAASDLKARGWTDTSIRDFLGEPDEMRPNPHYRRAAPMRLFDFGRIEAAEATPACKACLAEVRERRQRPPKDWAPTFKARYGRRSSALPAAAEALWNLNRYAKHDRCSKAHRDEIYELKNRLILHLIARGRLIAHGTHKLEKTARNKGECYQCNGDGCERCDFTGMHILPELVLYYVVLRFSVGDKTYTWHQPQESFEGRIPKDTPLLPDNGDWQQEREKPINLSPSRFARAKALIRWVMGPAREHVTGPYPRR